MCSPAAVPRRHCWERTPGQHCSLQRPQFPSMAARACLRLRRRRRRRRRRAGVHACYVTHGVFNKSSHDPLRSMMTDSYCLSRDLALTPAVRRALLNGWGGAGTGKAGLARVARREKQILQTRKTSEKVVHAASNHNPTAQPEQPKKSKESTARDYAGWCARSWADAREAPRGGAHRRRELRRRRAQDPRLPAGPFARPEHLGRGR